MTPRLLNRYIAKNVLSAIALVTLMLAGLQIFILFVNQLDDLGKANYGIMQVAGFVMLQMPYQVYLFFPMASLLGSLIGLGIMANYHELVVMRAAGMSIWQVTLAVLQAAFLVILLVTAIGETIVPRLAAMANDQKLQAMSEGQALRTAKGMWLRNQNDFITIGSVLSEYELQRVFQFHFDNTHRLQYTRKIDSLTFNQGIWTAHNVSESTLAHDQTKAAEYDTMTWEVPLKPNILKIGGDEPDEMTLPELQRYLHIQKKNHQSAVNYQLAYWQRILQPFTTVIMMVLAIPFIFGPLRSSTMGSKLLAGAAMGFGFHMINRIFGPISQVFQLPVMIAAFGPPLLFALLGLYLMKRVK
ncbi:LPS export ABC transporter permease LptG [Legionella impletisoli]|uniref:LPS export ABC transporter permease LptG n=1 Tax=Legionella impletisoli TaxID=343510 RepID=A0A917JT99_9GAMM|nr:LPS export ABC transporter permease LptG [Legionella impletisoli]GGI85889.1 LPS export ABC transporter permease LptG [Legionella impletisoli]